MSPVTGVSGLPTLVWAELRKLLSRPVARASLLVGAAIAAFGALALWWLSGSQVTMNGESVGASLDLSLPNAVRWGLVLRGFFAAQVLLATLGAMSVAGELQARTLRDDLVRPVARWQVLAAKWIALCAWSAISLASHFAIAGAIGALLLSWSGTTELRDVALGGLGMWLAECSFAAVALAVATLTRSVPGTLVALVLFLGFERFGGWAAQGLRSLMSMGGDPPTLFRLLPLLPSSAWSAWQDLAVGGTPLWEPWVALVGWTVAAVAVAAWRFERMDVP